MVIPLAALLIAPVCCGIAIPTSIGGPQPPAGRVVGPSQEALDSFNQEWQSAVLGPPGDFTVTFSETELTSVLWDSITQMEGETGEDIPISDVQVFLQDDTLYVYGTMDTGVGQSSGMVAAQPSVGPDGTLDIAITSVDVGLVQLSQSDIDALEAEVETVLNGWAAESGATLTGVAITDGQVIVTGATGP
jgi:hypothetical protein